MAYISCDTCKAKWSASPYNGSFVIYEGKHYCVTCLMSKRTNPRTRKDKWNSNEAPAKMAELLEKTKEHYEFLRQKEELFDYIDEYYSPSYIPSSFYAKLDGIFSGTQMGVKRPVPPEHLLDMLQRKANYLEKQAIKKWGSNPPEPMNRLNYDLAIVLSKYDGYLSWLEKQRIDTETAIAAAQERETASQYVYVKPQPKTKEEVDIGSIIDDLFD